MSQSIMLSAAAVADFSVPAPEGVLVVGGEDVQGTSRADVFCLRPRA